MGCSRTGPNFIKVESSSIPAIACIDVYYRDSEVKSNALKMFSKILKTTMHLPDRIQAICWVQFWAWIGIHLHLYPPGSLLIVPRLVPFSIL